MLKEATQATADKVMEDSGWTEFVCHLIVWLLGRDGAVLTSAVFMFSACQWKVLLM